MFDSLTDVQGRTVLQWLTLTLPAEGCWSKSPCLRGVWAELVGLRQLGATPLVRGGPQTCLLPDPGGRSVCLCLFVCFNQSRLHPRLSINFNKGW